MGYGFVIVCPKSQHNNVVSILDEYKIKNDVIGEIFSGSGVKVNGKSVL
jgi:phosphoribosylaminoimidazole (AIR) synthetase